MIALALCVLAFFATFFAGRRSLGVGMIALFTVGYFYGILRANLITTYSHFLFDAGLIGLYLSQNWFTFPPPEARRLEFLRIATALLIGWPLLLVLMPFQPLLISLVGLRGNILFIPLLLLVCMSVSIPSEILLADWQARMKMLRLWLQAHIWILCRQVAGMTG